MILNLRTRESWLRSMQNSVLYIISWKSWPYLAALDGFTTDWYALLTATTTILSKGLPAYKSHAKEALLQSFDTHYRRVKTFVPHENLLEFHPCMGWEPLCDFLECPVPDAPFPHLNGPEALVALRTAMYWERWGVVLQKSSCIAVLMVFAIALMSRWRQ